MKRFFNLSIGLIFLALVGLGLVMAFRPRPVLVDTLVVERGPLRVTIDEDGVTRIKERYVVSTPLAGRLQRIQLEVGDPVAAGVTVLATMQPTDPSLLDPRAVAQAEARVSAAERRLEAAQTDLMKAESELELATNEFERIDRLFQREIIPESEYDASQIGLRVRQQDVQAAGFRVDIAKFELELERAAMLLTDPTPDSPGEQGIQLEIKAPIQGRVLRIYQESSAVLTAGAPILEIGDPLDLEIVTDVLSMDAVQIQPGAAVELQNWGGPQPLAGEVRMVEPSGFTKLSALGVEEQRVNVIIDLLEPPAARGNLGDGFRVDSRIVVWQDNDVLKVPTSALFRVSGEWQVFVARDNTAQQLAVAIGQNNGIEAEVTQGLNEGDIVIVHPSDALADGVRIAPR